MFLKPLGRDSCKWKTGWRLSTSYFLQTTVASKEQTKNSSRLTDYYVSPLHLLDTYRIPWAQEIGCDSFKYKPFLGSISWPGLEFICMSRNPSVSWVCYCYEGVKETARRIWIWELVNRLSLWFVDDIRFQGLGFWILSSFYRIPFVCLILHLVLTCQPSLGCRKVNHPNMAQRYISWNLGCVTRRCVHTNWHGNSFDVAELGP